jgi:hypothetical protein
VKEAADLETYLEDWIRGKYESEDALSRLADVLADGFHIVPIPGYPVLDRAGLIDYMRLQRGTDPETERWVENVRIGYEGSGVCVVYYDEWQVRDGERKGSVISATFVDGPGTPNGVKFAHLHETPIDVAGPD